MPEPKLGDVIREQLQSLLEGDVAETSAALAALEALEKENERLRAELAKWDTFVSGIERANEHEGNYCLRNGHGDAFQLQAHIERLEAALQEWLRFHSSVHTAEELFEIAERTRRTLDAALPDTEGSE